MNLKLYSCHFTGHWPVGAVAVVLASGPGDARKRMRDALTAEGLDSTQMLEFKEIDMRTAGAHILLNGDC